MKAVLARLIATLLALVLVIVAAYLWLRPSSRASRPGEDAVGAAPPEHDDFSREDREALREILRDEDPAR
jgi:hypothetical protein